MWDHLKLYFSCQNTCSRTHCYMDGQPPCLVEDRGAQRWKAAPVEVLILLVDGPSGRGSVVMADIQHNVWVILLS